MNRSLPIPPSHKTFTFPYATLSSNFDSGNLFNVQSSSSNQFQLWLTVDHPKNQYRTWFYFSVEGVAAGSTVSFTIKNMQNQSRLLNEGLLPVYRQQHSQKWTRIPLKVDLAQLQYSQGCLEWTFRHHFTSTKKIFFAMFYPWSNDDNDLFLSKCEQECKNRDVYFKKSTIIRSIQGRPVNLVTISSFSQSSHKPDKVQDQHLFPEGGQPRQFSAGKRAMIVSARVHPGQVPASHVMNGIISQLIADTLQAKVLRDEFVFYLFPILNPDGVARGHYRVDTNGINLNRCYLNPSAKYHPSIYAVRKLILHFHSKGKYFGFLDLHAHAAKKGAFIYGNSSNILNQQVQICMFPKILSHNSQMFDYEGSNFMEKNMYVKQKNDHMSKQGAGRVAFFKATNNPRSWTLECNYNASRVINILTPPREQNQNFQQTIHENLNSQLIATYKQPPTKIPASFYKIEDYNELGKQICISLLDYIQMNPQSRIDNANSHFKTVKNLRLNLAVALIRMAPNRFETSFKTIFNYLDCNHQARTILALYYLIIKQASFTDLNKYIVNSDDSILSLPPQPVKPKKKSQIKIKSHYPAPTQDHTSRQLIQKEDDSLTSQLLSAQEIPIIVSADNKEDSLLKWNDLGSLIIDSKKLQKSQNARRQDRQKVGLKSLHSRNMPRQRESVTKPLRIELQVNVMVRKNGRLQGLSQQEARNKQLAELPFIRNRLRGMLNFNTVVADNDLHS